MSSHLRKNNKVHYKFSTKGKPKINKTWPFIISLITLAISFTINIVASIFTEKLSLGGAICVLVAIVLVGILFDILGTAVISCDIVSFSSMAAAKVRGAKESIAIIKKASVYSNIFNDVIGDTCGIISGATLGAIFIKISLSNADIRYTIASAIIAAITVGGKAIGKGFSMRNAESIVFIIGNIAATFNPSNYKVFNKKDNKKNKKNKHKNKNNINDSNIFDEDYDVKILSSSDKSIPNEIEEIEKEIELEDQLEFEEINKEVEEVEEEQLEETKEENNINDNINNEIN